MFLCALGDLVSCLANEDEIADFSVKILDPLVILECLSYPPAIKSVGPGIALMAWIAASGFVPLESL